MMRYPAQRHRSIPACVCVCAGKLICNSVGGAIVTGFLRLNDGENKEEEIRWGWVNAEEGLLGKMTRGHP